MTLSVNRKPHGNRLRLRALVYVCAMVFCGSLTPMAAHASRPLPYDARTAEQRLADLDSFVDTLPIPSPRELPDLARKIGKLIGKALGLEFALKLGACLASSDDAREFRRCVRGLVLDTGAPRS